MKRMTDKIAQQMLTFFADRLDLNNLPLDDGATFELFQRADTDGILMMESDCLSQLGNIQASWASPCSRFVVGLASALA